MVCVILVVVGGGIDVAELWVCVEEVEVERVIESPEGAAERPTLRTR